MKIVTLAFGVLLAFGGILPRLHAADPATWGSTHALTLALTLSYTAPANVLKDATGKVIPASDGGGTNYENTYSVNTMDTHGNVIKEVDTHEYFAKTTTARFGNAELLKLLAAGALLPPVGTEVDASPVGWSLVGVADVQGVITLYARHTTKVMVPLDGISFNATTDTPSATAVIQSTKEVTTTLNDIATGGSTASTAYSGTVTTQALGNGIVTYDANPLTFTGLYTETGTKTVLKTENLPAGRLDTPVFVTGVSKLDKIVGSSIVPIDLAPLGVVGGSMSYAAGVVVDLNVYLSSPPIH